MKKLFKCALCAAVIAPLLMATQCTTYVEPPGEYLIAVENNSAIAIDSLYVGETIKNSDALAWRWQKVKIKTPTSKIVGYVTSLMSSFDDKYRFEIRTTDSKVVADTIVTLAPLPELGGDHIKVTLILEKDGKLRIDKQPVSKK